MWLHPRRQLVALIEDVIGAYCDSRFKGLFHELQNLILYPRVAFHHKSMVGLLHEPRKLTTHCFGTLPCLVIIATDARFGKTVVAHRELLATTAQTSPHK